MPIWLTVMLVILIVLIVFMVAMYFLGKRAEKKQAEQDEVLKQNQQQVTMLVIDKKKIAAKNAPFPETVTNQIPWYLKRSKLPVVKAKVGPQIMNFLAENDVYDQIPVKREVKATISGLYITSFRGIRKNDTEKKEEKKGFLSRFRRKKEDKK